MPLVNDAARASAALVPDAGTATFLAHASLILAPELDLDVVMGAGDLLKGLIADARHTLGVEAYPSAEYRG